MNKKQVKQIEITDVIIHRLSSSSDESGEYSTSCNVDFVLSEPFSFQVFDKNHVFDRIKMGVSWGDETELYYANSETSFIPFSVTKTLIQKIYDRVKHEQKEGCLKGWCFDDGIFEMLTGKRNLILLLRRNHSMPNDIQSIPGPQLDVEILRVLLDQKVTDQLKLIGQCAVASEWAARQYELVHPDGTPVPTCPKFSTTWEGLESRPIPGRFA